MDENYLGHHSLVNMALLQGGPNVLGSGALFDELMFGRCTFHEKEHLNGGIVLSPMAISARFIIWVRSGEGVIEVLVQERNLEDAYDMAAPGNIVVCSLVEYGHISPTGVLHIQ